MNECYTCEYRGNVAGSCHSSCHHPSFKKVHEDPLLGILGIFASTLRLAPVQVQNDKCKVTGDPHGIKNGWFNHPFNFDPVWIIKCTGYEAKTNTK